MDSLEALQRDRPVEITPAMIEAGLAAYIQCGAHDEFSFLSPTQLVESVLEAALSHSSNIRSR